MSKYVYTHKRTPVQAYGNARAGKQTNIKKTARDRSPAVTKFIKKLERSPFKPDRRRS